MKTKIFMKLLNGNNLKNKLTLILFLLLFYNTNILNAQKQGQALLDSLIKELDKNIANDTNKVNLLNDIAFELNTTNPNKGIEYAQQGIKLAKKLKFEKGLAKCYNCLGVCNWAKSDYPKALEYYFKSMSINERIGNKYGIASNLGNIGLVFQEQADYPKALNYFFSAMRLNEKLGNINGLSSNLGLIGNVYNEQAKYKEALEFYFKALKLNEELGKKNGIAINLVNIGRVYRMQFEYKKALEFFFRSLKINEELRRERGIMYNIGYIGEIYLLIANDISKEEQVKNPKDKVNKESNLKKSIEYSLKAVSISKAINAEKELSDWYINLSKAYKELHFWEKAYSYADSSFTLYKNVFSQENKNKLASLEAKRAQEIKEKETEIENKQRRLIIWCTGIGIISLIIFILFIIRERRKSEKLLLNILPSKIEKRLKKKEKYIADHFDEASVVFIDISQFTQLSKGAKPERVVEVLNKIYTEFDHIASKYNLEKIKTIGDCYMAASGIPIPRTDSAKYAAEFAIEAMQKMNGYDTGDGTIITFKVGIDCGPVVAGIIGEKKFIYDLWGDTVNTAARMEEYSEAGKIQVTDRFLNKLKIEYGPGSINFVERGEIEIKGKGLMKTYFLEKLIN